jgi:hypothetical protein
MITHTLCYYSESNSDMIFYMLTLFDHFSLLLSYYSVGYTRFTKQYPLGVLHSQPKR